ncbi:MAG: DUF5331 domain-containing protein [Elainellaceae cyanobacterium]
MNVQQLRQSLRHRWLIYYRDNRDWLVHLAVWVNDNGQRRPSSSFILATLSVLEPRLTQLLPLVVGLSNSPDRIITALGLNFSPDDALEDLDLAQNQPDPQPKMLPAQVSPPVESASMEASGERSPSEMAAQKDENCGGRHGDNPRDR